ncbi:hypothetical protein FRC16_002287 [Serendipita sp. 398]|nr:hypothetical protein FRC16_002287 [Serendipita sp. 398]
MKNFTIDDSSPVIRYTPNPTFAVNIFPDPLLNWSPVCGAIDASERCDDHSAHVTGLDGAKFALSFFGTGINLFGNLTLGTTFSMNIDGNTVSNGLSGGEGADSQILAKVSGLSPALHTLILTVKKGEDIRGLFTFDYAQILVGNATSFNRTVIDAFSDQLRLGPAEPRYLLVYPSFSAFSINSPRSEADNSHSSESWNRYGGYNASVPDGVNFSSFRATDVMGANVYAAFKGSTLFYYGPCYTASHAYTVSLDGGANSQPVQLNASVPFTQVVARCLRYYSGGLSTQISDSGSQIEHEILITNSQDKKWLTIHWLEMWDFQLVESTGISTGAS